MRPRNNARLDYQGLRGPRQVWGYCRTRFRMMGGCNSPSYQLQWVASIKEVVNRVVLRTVASKHIVGNGISQIQRNDLEVVEIAPMHMDDGKTRHPACFT